MTWRVDVGDCVEIMARMESSSVDAVVCDPPYHLSFMGREWDRADGVAIDAAFGHWLAGFIDGEGCFHVHRKPQGTFDCQFSITLRGDDMPILERCQRETGLGTLTMQKNGDGHPKARWTVSSKAQCVGLRDLLRAFPLRAKKARDFEAWSEALQAWVEHERGEWGDMEEARARLMGMRDYEDGGVKIDPSQLWHFRWAVEALRVLKPGGHLLAFGGTRTSHRLACALEDAGFEIRDTICWLYGSGFPKSLDVGKAIDKAHGAERDITRHEARPLVSGEFISFDQRASTERERRDEPVTPGAERWDGWGTALKPAHEPIVVARKPLAGTVTANVLEHGTGGLNVNGCRVGTTDNLDGGAYAKSGTERDDGWGMQRGQAGEYVQPSGRWPSNLVLDEQAAAMLDQQSGERPSSGGAAFTRGGYNRPLGERDTHGGELGYGDSGGASRFFYTAKASRVERNAGLDGFEAEVVHDGRHTPISNPYLRAETQRRNTHPTVKPVSLMRWLVRLVTPPQGLVLDPFTGSGTTGIAAVLEGFNFLGCEQDEGYADIARARIGWWELHGHDALRIVAEQEAAENEREQIRQSGQMELL